MQSLAVCRAVDLQEDLSVGRRGRLLQKVMRKTIPMLTEDRRQGRDIHAMLELYRVSGLPVGEVSESDYCDH